MYGIAELETFVQVARRGGITAAAQHLGIATATVSHRVSKLEHALQLTLFHRNSRSVALTDEGEIFLARVEGILEDLHLAELEAGGRSGDLRGHLRVTLSPWILSRFILPRLAGFRRHHPALTIEFLAVDRFVSLVDEGQDCAIRVGQLKDSALIASKVADNDRIICAAPRYLTEKGAPDTAEDLAALDWVCLPWQTRWTIRIDGGRRSEIAAQRSVFVSNSDMLTEAAVQGLGLAVKSRLAVKSELDAGALVEVLPGTLEPQDAPIWYLTTPDARAGRKTKAFGALVKAAFRPG